VRVATLKHAHHAFDVDQPGKDSYEHRKAGACEVIISSSRRWVQMHELGESREATLGELLKRVSPCDFVLVEGFKTERHPKLEVYRKAVGKSPLYPADDRIVGVASDQPLANATVPVIELNEIPAIARFILERAEPMAQVLATLERPSATP
jgi:molybdopterin-guanine dinucleotide biosynthesis adapter protein